MHVDYPKHYKLELWYTLLAFELNVCFFMHFKSRPPTHICHMGDGSSQDSSLTSLSLLFVKTRVIQQRKTSWVGNLQGFKYRIDLHKVGRLKKHKRKHFCKAMF